MDAGSELKVSHSPAGIKKAQQARELLQLGHWLQAKALYLELVADFPSDIELRRHIVLTAFKCKDYSETLQQTLDLADLALANGDIRGSLDRYSEVLRLPELILGDREPEAARAIQEVVESLKADIYFAFGDYYLGQGSVDLALQYLEASQRLEPMRWETYWGKGQAYLLKGEKKEAVRLLHQSIQIAPKEAASAYELLGEIFLGEGRDIKILRKYFVNAVAIFEAYECFEDALRVGYRWLQLEPQDREIADRVLRLTELLHVDEFS